MEFVDGLSLRHLMKGRGLTPEEALKVVPKICESLEYAHSKGVIHRDIKPENILIDREGRVKIADFGLARLIAGNDPASQVTATHVVMGTPGYMAPEQYQSMSVDHRADIYSLGAVFYEMLTGQLPVGRFDPPSRKIQVDVRLDEIVLKTLENEPDRRYQRAVDVKTDVEAVSWRPRLKGEPAGFARPLEPRRELRILFWIPFTIIAVVVLGLGVFLMASGGAVGLIIGATLIPIVYLASRRMQASIAEWAGELPVSTGPRVSRSSMSAFLLVILSYALMLGITVADQFTDHGWSFYYKARALALLFPFAQVLAIVLAIIALTHISHSGGRLTGRLYAYLAVFLVLPPVGQIAGYILWRVFDRKPAALPTSRESAEAPKARLSSLAVISLILTVGGIFLTGALFFMFPYMGMAA
jgi:hypothetical protein